MRKLFLTLILPTVVHAQSYSILPGYDWTYLLCNPATTTLDDDYYLAICGVEKPAVADTEPLTAPVDSEPEVVDTEPEVLDPEPEAPAATVSAPLEETAAPPDPPVTLELSSSAEWIPRSGSVTLSWQSTGATSCTASGDWSGSLAVSGEMRMDALTEDQTYTLVCENATNTSVALLDVYIRQAILTWELPTANTDGSPLTLSDLDRYRVYWGSASRTYKHKTDIVDPAQMSLILELPAGIYYFSMTAINTEGNESSLSAEGSKEIK